MITDVEAEWNGLGYSGTNAGGDLVITRSSFHDNRAGIVPNSGTEEKLSPQRGLTIVGNTVYSNNNPKTAAIDIASSRSATASSSPAATTTWSNATSCTRRSSPASR